MEPASWVSRELRPSNHFEGPPRLATSPAPYLNSRQAPPAPPPIVRIIRISAPQRLLSSSSHDRIIPPMLQSPTRNAPGPWIELTRGKLNTSILCLTLILWLTI